MPVSRFRIEDMDCATEEALIRGKLEGMEGVEALEFQLVQRVLTVRHGLTSDTPLASAIASLGMDALPLVAESPTPPTRPASSSAAWAVLALAGGAALGSEVAEWARWWQPWLPAALALVAVGLSGWKVYLKGWISLRNGQLNINALMSLAVTGAAILQLWPEAASVMVLFAVAERIEGLSLDRARRSLAGLLDLAPDQTTVRRADQWVRVPSASVPVGATVRIRPGERLSHDGVVRQGASSIDQSPITGESLPVDKGVGDAVYAGTINHQGELEVEVTDLASNSTLSRIAHLVEEAQGNRAPTQRFVDRFASIYTPIVVALALLTAVLPPLLGWGAWLDWAYKALVLLVIACPCALVVSTPVTLVSGLAAATRAGLVVKGGLYLEQGRHLDVVAFDKTGTLTHGTPRQTDFVPLHGQPSRLQAWARSLASRSDHPVSAALARSAAGGAGPSLEVRHFEAVAGCGVRGTVDATPLLLGNARWMKTLGLDTDVVGAQLAAFEAQGKTVVLLADAERVLALFAVADTVRDTSRTTVHELRRRGITPVLLSGDSATTVQAVAREVGIADARGAQLPHDKLAALAELARAGHRVGMVGDGINDAPALAQAQVGFAMGGLGSGTALEAADVVLMDDDLRKIPVFLDLSRRTATILTQNISLALVLKAIFFGLTLAGWGTMWMAVFADMGTSLLVVFNGLRLLSPQAPAR